MFKTMTKIFMNHKAKYMTTTTYIHVNTPNPSQPFIHQDTQVNII